MHVGYALGDGFLNPFVHFIFILIEPVTAKDVAARKRWWCNGTEVCLCVRIMWSRHIPPGQFQYIIGIMRPLRAGLLKELTQILDRSSAESAPVAGSLVGVGHGIDGRRKRLWFFVPVSILLCHHAQYLKRHAYPRFPSKSQRRACSMLSAYFSRPPGNRYLSTTCCACSRVRIRVFESSIAQSARSLSRPAAILRARMYSRGGA